MRLSDHPRARASIRRAKGIAGLGTFLVVGFLALRAGILAPEALVRALIAGLAAYWLAWGVAVTVWRQIALGELEAARKRRESRLAAFEDAPGE